jgi:TetR/AcrR family transcriptional repressor of nem operon
MGRPRSFDTQAAIAGATEVFRTHGYAGAAMPVLLEGMGIARGSLYKAWSDKRAVFLDALRAYEADVIEPMIATLDGSAPDAPARGRDRVEAVLEAAVARAEDGDRRGCLLVTTAAGAAATDEAIAETARDMLERLREAFGAAMREEAWSYMLITQYCGLQTLIRSGAPMSVVRAAPATVVAILPRGA